jgi:aminopeptidase YwaD
VKACYHYAEHPPERELRIVFFSAEELGLRGSFAYVRDHEDEVRSRGRLVVNVDLSGDPIGQDRFNVLGTRELLGYAGGIARENGLMFSEALDIYSSDCMPFAVHEVPSVNILRSGGSGIHYVHTADDRAANVSPRGLENTYRATEAILDRVLAAEIYPVRRAIDPSLREKIENYLWQSTREKPEIKWKESYRR